jgi:hypothetical protein
MSNIRDYHDELEEEEGKTEDPSHEVFTDGELGFYKRLAFEFQLFQGDLMICRGCRVFGRARLVRESLYKKTAPPVPEELLGTTLCGSCDPSGLRLIRQVVSIQPILSLIFGTLINMSYLSCALCENQN